MKTTNSRPLLSFTAISLLCLGFLGNVASLNAQTKQKKKTGTPTGATPAITATNKMIVEAEKYFTDMLSKYVIKCTDGTSYLLKVGAVYQFKDFAVSVKVDAPEFLSPVDKLNGLELTGEARLFPKDWYKKYPASFALSLERYKEEPQWSKHLETPGVEFLSLRFQKINGKYQIEGMPLAFSGDCNFIQSFLAKRIAPSPYNLIIKPKIDQKLQQSLTRCGNRSYFPVNESTLLEVENLKTDTDPPEWHYKAANLDEWKGTLMFYGGQYRLWNAPGRIADAGTLGSTPFLTYKYEVEPARRSSRVIFSNVADDRLSTFEDRWRWNFPTSPTQRAMGSASNVTVTCDVAERFIRGEKVVLPVRSLPPRSW